VAPSGARSEAVDPFQQPVIASRWLFVIGVLVETSLQLGRNHGHIDRPTVVSLAFVCLYNVVALLGVHRIPRRRLRGWALLTIDLVSLGAAAYNTNGPASPFLGMYYLVIFSGALLYGLSGGLITGAIAALITWGLYLAHSSKDYSDVRDLIPYFVITGGFTGYLSHRLRLTFRQARETAAREQQRVSEEDALQRELETARTMQTAALPPAPIAMPGISVGLRWEFARMVGGDFYAYVTEGSTLCLVLGDVSGKGMPAALIATSITYLLPWLQPLQDPQNALCNLNHDLESRLPPNAFVTLAIAEVNPVQGTVRLWSAGHPPALRWSARERRVYESSQVAPILGVIPDWHGEPENWPLEPGDVIVLYSDGLIETRSATGDLFDVERAAAALAAHADLSADEIAGALVCAAKSWGAPTDDLTVLVCKRDVE